MYRVLKNLRLKKRKTQAQILKGLAHRKIHHYVITQEISPKLRAKQTEMTNTCLKCMKWSFFTLN